MGSQRPHQLVLLGHFLTRREATRRSGLSLQVLLTHPGVLHLAGCNALEEVYAGFQFGPGGLRNDLAVTVEAFGPGSDPWGICDWITRSNPRLDGKTPLTFLDDAGELARVVGAAAQAPPHDGTLQ